MNRNVIETVVGFIVLAIAVGFIITAYQSGSLDNKQFKGYTLSAQFDRADGLSIGSDVRLSGIKIGRVLEMKINPANYDAVVNFIVDSKYKIPADSSAEIIGNGLLGEKYIAIVPGADNEFLAPNGQLEFTQSSISLESLIGRFIFGSTNAKKPNETGSEHQGAEHHHDDHPKDENNAKR